MNNKGRVLTLVIEIIKETYPQWILDAHILEPRNDIIIKSIIEGDVRKNIEQLEKELQTDTYFIDDEHPLTTKQIDSCLEVSKGREL